MPASRVTVTTDVLLKTFSTLVTGLKETVPSATPWTSNVWPDCRPPTPPSGWNVAVCSTVKPDTTVPNTATSLIMPRPRNPPSSTTAPSFTSSSWPAPDQLRAAGSSVPPPRSRTSVKSRILPEPTIMVPSCDRATSPIIMLLAKPEGVAGIKIVPVLTSVFTLTAVDRPMSKTPALLNSPWTVSEWSTSNVPAPAPMDSMSSVMAGSALPIVTVYVPAVVSAASAVLASGNVPPLQSVATVQSPLTAFN